MRFPRFTVLHAGQIFLTEDRTFINLNRIQNLLGVNWRSPWRFLASTIIEATSRHYNAIGRQKILKILILF